MIVRSMLENPDQPFDYFNDYKDTICWLSRQFLTGTDQEMDQAVYAEANRVWDADRFVEDDSLLLTDALLVPSLAEAIRCTVVFWDRLAKWRP